MKKLLFGSLALLAMVFGAPSPSTANTVKYLEITVVSASVWPVKPSGKCWDPCFMKKYELPARGAANYLDYFKNPNFREVCTGSKAPDPLVEITLGKYEKFTTDKVNNQCNPTFNVKKVFRVEDNAPFTASVYDNDGGAGFQLKRELMGVKSWPSIPPELANGGKLVIKSFGQVEELVLEAKVIQRPTVATTGCDGTYQVRVVEYDVKDKKADGKPWDRGFGKFKLPDVTVTLKVGDVTIQTPKQQDTTQHTFTGEGRPVAIKKGMTIFVGVYDKDGLGQQETIGETTLGDVCTVISAGGQHTFADFGQVNKVVIIFTKLQ